MGSATGCSGGEVEIGGARAIGACQGVGAGRSRGRGCRLPIRREVMEGILAGPRRPALPFSFVVKPCCRPPPFLSGDRGGRPLRDRRIGGGEAAVALGDD